MPNQPENNPNITSPAIQKEESPRIEVSDFITRVDIRAQKDKIFLFGDNLAKKGFGGQAKEMRGEENAIGIPTKKAPSNNPKAFFTDQEFATNKKAIDEAFGKIPPDKIIVIPKAGLGTGLAVLEEKAPETFAYLNQKLSEIGFHNPRKEADKTAEPQVVSQNKVTVQNEQSKTPTAKRLLDLNNVKTDSLKVLSPTEKETNALKIDAEQALADYAERIRLDYKTNRDNFRDGLRILSDSLEKGEQITVICSCRNGAMCHAEVVKLAIEKVHAYFKDPSIQKNRNDPSASLSAVREDSNTKPVKSAQTMNPRTERAIREVLAVSESDRRLGQINRNESGNRTEHASYLGKFSQFTRDIYERGGNAADGKLIIPRETPTLPAPVAMTTAEYAVKRLGAILRDDFKVREIVPKVVDYGNKIAGATSDGATKIKVFTWIYDALEGKSEFLAPAEPAPKFESKEQKFETTLTEIARLAEQMHALEPSDKLPLTTLAELEKTEGKRENFTENYYAEKDYATQENGEFDRETPEHGEFTQSGDAENSPESTAGLAGEGYEIIELNEKIPLLPASFDERETMRLLTETLPEVDRLLESGATVYDILKPFDENIRRSAKLNALNRLETIYREEKIGSLKTELTVPDIPVARKDTIEKEISRLDSLVLTPGNERHERRDARQKTANNQKTVAQDSRLAETPREDLKQQIEKADIRRRTIIELKTPHEFFAANELFEKTATRKIKTETGALRLRLEKIRGAKNGSTSPTRLEHDLQKELSEIRSLKPAVAWKLENSAETVIGRVSLQAAEKREFVAAWLNYRLMQPETVLRRENPRYRQAVKKLDMATSRKEVIKTASDIRLENAALAIKQVGTGEKSGETSPLRPLTINEMRRLFSEDAPDRYTPEMTVARRSYAHAGVSRRLLTESLLKGEINPSPEAVKLVESLDARLNRRELKEAISATKHFLESLKLPAENLKIKNDFDHREIYRRLPPQEKDFVYAKAVAQKENLEYRTAFAQAKFSRPEPKPQELETSPPIESRAEKSFGLRSIFYQARILGASIESEPLASKEIGTADFHAVRFLLLNHSNEKLAAVGAELKTGANLPEKKIGEILETFSKAIVTVEEKAKTVSVKLPAASLVAKETYAELLERFYPSESGANDKFKFANYHEKTLENARIKGQDEALKISRAEVVAAFGNVPDALLETAKGFIEDYAELAAKQNEARAARAENTHITENYRQQAAVEQSGKKANLPPLTVQKQLVAVALGVSVSPSDSVPTREEREFFAALQKKISVADFRQFTENDRLISGATPEIRRLFTEISAKETVLRENGLRQTPSFAVEKAQIGETRETGNQKTTLEENKPLSLQIYEKEIEKVEERLVAENLKEKLAGKDEELIDAENLFSSQEREEIRINAAEIAKEKLEPKELDADHRKVSIEAGKQALETFKQLERAANIFQFGNDPNKIREAFAKLDTAAVALSEIRRVYDKREKIALLRGGIKSDIIDLFGKNSAGKTLDLAKFLPTIISKNFRQAGFVGIAEDTGQIVKISREIGEKLESKQFFAVQEGQNLVSGESKETQISGRILEAATEKIKPKLEQAKDLFVRSR